MFPAQWDAGNTGEGNPSQHGGPGKASRVRGRFRAGLEGRMGFSSRNWMWEGRWELEHPRRGRRVWVGGGGTAAACWRAGSAGATQEKPPRATLSTLELNLGCHGRFKREPDRPLSMRCQAVCDKLCSQHLTPDSKPSWEGSIMTPTLQMKEPRSRKGKWFANREWSQTRYVGVTDGQAQSLNHCRTASQYEALENGNKKESVSSSFLEVVCCNGWRKERDIWSLSPRVSSATSFPCPLVQIPPNSQQLRAGPEDSRGLQSWPDAIPPRKGSFLKWSWQTPRGDSGSSGRTEVSEASRLLKLPLKYFTVVEKGRRKEEEREGGREAESWKEGEREGLWFTHTKCLAKGKMRAWDEVAALCTGSICYTSRCVWAAEKKGGICLSGVCPIPFIYLFIYFIFYYFF